MDKKYKIKDIYDKLKKIGFDKSYLKKFILPDWWEDEIAKTTNGFIIFCGIISKNLSLDYSFLIKNEIKFGIFEDDGISFNHKMNNNYSERDVQLADLISLKIAKLVNSINKNKFRKLPANVKNIRKEIITVTFENLLDYCWNLGISVIHLSNFPKKAKKFMGLSGYISERPFIILAKKYKYESYQLFDLAHELGHLVLKHSNSNKYLYDYEVNSSDLIEIEANEFATELITGQKNIIFPNNNLTTTKLLNFSKEKANELNTDAGFIALNYAKKFDRFAVAHGVLKNLPNKNTIELMYNYLVKNTNESDIQEDVYDFIINMISK